MTSCEIDLRVGGAWRYTIIDSGIKGGMQEGLDLLEEVARSLR